MMSRGKEQNVRSVFFCLYHRRRTLRSVSQNPWPLITMKKSLLLLAMIAVLSSCSKDEDPVAPAPAPVVIETPVTYTISTITLSDFNMTNASGQPWDALPNVGPDPFVQVVNGGTILFASTAAANVTTPGPHDMSTASVGSIPITLNYGSSTKFEVYDNDGNGFTEFIGQAIMQGSYLYANDNASQFTDVEIIGTNDVKVLVSGTFSY